MAAVHLVGIDVGTTNTKATLIASDGRVVAEAVRPSRLVQRGPGWVEQDLLEMAADAEGAVSECVARSGVAPASVAAIGVTGQMAGIAAIDAAWEPVAPYDSWLDTRCEPYVEVMRRQQDRIIAACGAPPTYSHGPKILWWMHHRPEIFRRVYRFVMPAAFVAGRLAGLRGAQAFIDPTYLHFSCLADTARAAWSEELCAAFGVPADKLPAIVESTQVVGRLAAGVAARLGLLEGTPVVAGAGDQSAAMLGAGVMRPGMAYDATGTACAFALCLPSFLPDVCHRTLVIGRLPVPGRWYALGYINGGGINLRWMRDMLRGLLPEPAAAGSLDYPDLDRLAQRVAPGSDGLVFVPHLGGRVCPNRPAMRGAWVGLRWTHTLGHLYRALLEGVAYEYAIYLAIARELAPGVEPGEVRVVGGGALSAVWNQIKADVLGLPYVRLNLTEAASLGAALVAGLGVGVLRDPEEAASAFVRPVARVQPRPDAHRTYAAAAELYRTLVDGFPEMWARVGAL